jgi:DNA polymerase-3 subunit alpha
VSNFVHLHCHSEFSPLDGLSTTPELAQQAATHGQFAMAITDHGVCSGHPSFQRSAKEFGIKPIFGLESYLVDDRFKRAEPMPDLPEVDANGQPFKTKKAQTEYHTELKEAAKARNKQLLRGYYHMILLAKNQTGLRNLWALSSETFRSGFYQYPKTDWDLLAKYSEGIVATTACLRGPVADAVLNEDENLAKARLARLLDIYGDDLYLELHANQLDKQLKVNTSLVQMGKDFGVPLVSVVDSHYPTDAAHEAHRAWIACQTNQDINNEGDLFAQDLGLYVKAEDEVRRDLEYLSATAVDESIANTVSIANSCDASVSRKGGTPTFSKVGGPDRDAERLLEVCLSNWERRTVGKRHGQDVYMARFEREFRLLKDKGFCGYFLFVWDYVDYAKRNGVLVGPGRGSGGGSLVAYLCGITEIDPVDCELLFERFMTEGRTELPDFDVDFPTSKRDMLQSYLTDKYGEDYVIRVGTHLRLKNKGIVKDLFRALKSTLDVPQDSYTDSTKVAKIIDAAEAGTAGLGMPWDELWVQHEEELTPFREKYPQVFDMADQLVGRLKSYGKHAAGLVISSDEPLTEAIPLRSADEAQMISQFEMDDLTDLGLVKFDLLTLRTLDTLQVAVDTIQERHGVRITPYDWKDEYEDQNVYQMLSDGHTLGVFQFETTAMTRLTKRLKPWNMNHLADINSLVRPGPMRAGLTESYLRRIAGKEEVVVPHPWLENSLLKSQGVMLYQEDIMQATMILAGYSPMRPMRSVRSSVRNSWKRSSRPVESLSHGLPKKGWIRARQSGSGSRWPSSQSMHSTGLTPTPTPFWDSGVRG